MITHILAKRDPCDTRPALLFVQDEGRFGRISTHKRAWAPPGIRPKSPRQIVRSYTYAYVAVSPISGKMTSLILPFANSDMMTIFLDHVSNEYPDHYILMLMDRAGWHRSNKLKNYQNIQFIYQPSHSPELNPVEHIWEEVREKHFYNKAYHSLDEVENTLCKGLNSLGQNPKKVESMTKFPYLNVTL